MDLSLYTMLQILSVTLFEKTPLMQLFSEMDLKAMDNEIPNQLNLFD
jgi:hypothetical protein